MLTKEGRETLLRRLNDLCLIYGDENQGYPHTYKVLDFPDMQVNNRREILNRIKELSEILGVDVELSVKVNITEVKNDN